jgi:hypothetical protein
MVAAQREAHLKARLSTSDPTYACSDAHHGIKQTAKRSVTRKSDNDPKEEAK